VKRLRLFLWGLVAVAVGLFALFAFRLRQPKDDFVHSAMVGQPMPQFALPAIAPDRPGLSSADFAHG